MNVGILGAGHIAEKMAFTLSKMKINGIHTIASRSADKAESFRQKFGMANACSSYEELLNDKDIDLVYIAIPNNLHYKWVIKALNCGKNVLCEKPFALNHDQAKEMIEVAQQKGLLLAEAIWTRYMPSRKIIRNLIDEGAIGKVHSLTANLGYDVDQKERVAQKALGGGGLLDLGVYLLNFASMCFGNDIKKISSNTVLTSNGVDGHTNISITYNDGKFADMFSTIYTLTDRRGIIYGENGRIEVQNINNPEKIFLYSADRVNPKITEFPVPEQITGFEYQILACQNAIQNNKTECIEMPHSEILEIMKQIDTIQKQF